MALLWRGTPCAADPLIVEACSDGEIVTQCKSLDDNWLLCEGAMQMPSS